MNIEKNDNEWYPENCDRCDAIVGYFKLYQTEQWPAVNIYCLKCHDFLYEKGLL